MQRILFVLFAVAALAGCASSSGRQPAVSLEGHSGYNILPVIITGKTLRASLPVGWARTTRGTLNDDVELSLVNVRTGARIDVLAFPEGTRVASILSRARDRLPSPKATVELRNTYPLEFWFKDKAGINGRIYILRFSDGSLALVIGSWSDKTEFESSMDAYFFAPSVEPDPHLLPVIGTPPEQTATPPVRTPLPQCPPGFNCNHIR